MFALVDGLEQEDRDAKLRAEGDYVLFEWLWEYDAVARGREAWTGYSQGREGTRARM